MATSFYAPDPVQSTFLIPGSNTPGNGVKVFFYVAGSSTKETVYQDEAGLTAHANPIVLDSGGNLPGTGSVWFTAGVNYDVVYAPSNDTDPPVSPYKTLQDLSGINDIASQTGVQWLSGPTPTFVGTTRLTVAGDQTATLHLGRRIQTTNTGGTIYSVVTSSVFSTSTAIGVANDSGALDSGLSALSYGLLSATNPSVAADVTNRYFSSMPSAGNGTTNVFAMSGDYTHVTGTNTIFNFGIAPYAGNTRDVVFDGILTISTTAARGFPQSVTTAANDSIRLRADTVSTFTAMSYTRASGFPSYPASSTLPNIVLAGPSTAAGLPAYRSLVINDLPAGMTLISTAAFPASSTNPVLNLPSTYAGLYIDVSGASFDQGPIVPTIQVSTTNGASWDSTAANYQGSFITGAGAGINSLASLISPDAQAAATVANFSLYLFGYQNGIKAIATAGGNTANAASTFTSVIQHNATSAINAIRFTHNNTSGVYDAGTYSVWGIR